MLLKILYKEDYEKPYRTYTFLPIRQGLRYDTSRWKVAEDTMVATRAKTIHPTRLGLWISRLWHVERANVKSNKRLSLPKKIWYAPIGVYYVPTKGWYYRAWNWTQLKWTNIPVKE